MDKDLFNELIGSVKEAGKIKRGQKKAVRITVTSSDYRAVVAFRKRRGRTYSLADIKRRDGLAD